MELREFRYVIAVAEARHLGRAAERLHMSQSGLSRQVRALEQQFGTDLFVRDRRGLTPTASGEVLLAYARAVAELADRATTNARLGHTRGRSILRVGTSHSGVHPIGRRALRAFAARFPNVDVQVHPGFSPDNLGALERGELDAAFVLVPSGASHSVRYTPLGSVEFLIAVPAGHRLARFDRVPREELLREPFFDLPRSVNPLLIDHLRRSLLGDAPHPLLVEMWDVAALTRLLLVAGGRGVSLVCCPKLESLHIAGVEYRRPEGPSLMVEYGVVWVDRHASGKVPAFVDLAGAFGDRPAKAV